MCGIFIFFNSRMNCQLSEKQKKEGMQSIRYRGRDGQGVWNDEFVTMGHTRLAIIDLKDGSQPMLDTSERYVITFNGEIYNYLEIQKEYEALGAKFITHSDTEVILEGFKLKGEKVLQDLNGMFAFVIYDRKEKRVFIARDRMGKKPLFWAKTKDTYIFSSTIKTLEPYITKKLNHQYLEEVRAFGSSISNSTVWQDIQSFPSASYATLFNTEEILKPQEYWGISFVKKSKGSLQEHIEEYEDILTGAICMRLRSDVPLCLTFSGGVDSGTIAAIAAKKLNQKPNLFCIDYDTVEQRSPEVILAQDVAKILDLPLTFINYDFKNDMLSDFQKEYQNFDQPCLQFPLVYSGVLYRHIHKSAKVTLSGNGADEMFTGYNGDEGNYYKNYIYKALYPIFTYLKFPLIPSVLTKGIVQNYCDLHSAEISSNVLEKLKEELMSANVQDYYDLQMYMGLKYGVRDSNFRLPDITGLTHQVEVRSPFFDYRMIEFAAALPLRYKIKRKGLRSFAQKYLMREFYKRYVGHEYAYAPKMGMGYNFTFPQEIGKGGEIYQAILKSLNNLSSWNIAKAPFQEALDIFMDNMKHDFQSPKNCSDMMFGFMLGSWLVKNS